MTEYVMLARFFAKFWPELKDLLCYLVIRWPDLLSFIWLSSDQIRNASQIFCKILARIKGSMLSGHLMTRFTYSFIWLSNDRIYVMLARFFAKLQPELKELCYLVIRWSDLLTVLFGYIITEYIMLARFFAKFWPELKDLCYLNIRCPDLLTVLFGYPITKYLMLARFMYSFI